MSDIEYGTGKYSTREGRAMIRSIVSMSWDGGDIQFSVLGPLFGVCEVLHAFGEHVPDECEFSPGAAVRTAESLADEWPDSEFAQMFTDGEITADDLQYWARVLARCNDMIPADQRY